MKKVILGTILVAASLNLFGCSNGEMVAKTEYDTVIEENQKLEDQIDKLKEQINTLEQETLIPQLKQEAQQVIDDIASIGEVTLDKEQLISSIEKEYTDLREAAKEYVTNYDVLLSAKTRIQTLKDSQTDEQKADEYKKSCIVGYDYTELARDPDTYVGKNVKFVGEVIQVSEGSGSTIMRVNVTKGKYGWDDTMYVTYTPKSGEPRILEDDIIAIYGEMQPIKTYTTVMGADVSIPAIDAKYIDIV